MSVQQVLSHRYPSAIRMGGPASLTGHHHVVVRPAGLDDAFGTLFVLRDSDDGDVHILGGHRCEEVGLESCLVDELGDVLAGRADPGGVGGEPDIEDQRWMPRQVWAGPRLVQASTACSATLAGVRFGTVQSANEVPVGVSARGSITVSCSTITRALVPT